MRNSDATIEEAYQHYLFSKAPSYPQTAAVFGVSARSVEEWARAGKWQERYAEDQRRMVAAIRHNAERELDALLPRALDTMAELLDSPSDNVRFQAARHIMGLRGLIVNTRVESKSVSVVQHVRTGSETGSSGAALDVFRDRVAELVGMDTPHPLPPGDYEEEREEDDERVPTARIGGRENISPTARIEDGETIGMTTDGVVLGDVVDVNE